MKSKKDLVFFIKQGKTRAMRRFETTMDLKFDKYAYKQ